MRAVLHQGLMGQSAAASVRALLDATSPAPQGTRNAAPTAAAEGLSISFKDVAFSYPGGRSITHQGMSFDIRPGERVGLVGPSAIGRATCRERVGQYVEISVAVGSLTKKTK